MIRYYCDACGTQVDDNFGRKPILLNSKLCLTKDQDPVPKYYLEIKTFSFEEGESIILCKDCITKILKGEL